MKLGNKEFYIEIENLFIIILISFLISDKIKLFLTSYYICYLFIVFHELSHILFGSIFEKKIKKLKITIAGVCVTFYKSNEISYFKELIIYLAGPLSNILFAFMFKSINLVFEINIFLAILNLMPIFPLDGHHIVKQIMKICNIIDNERKVLLIENVFFFILFIISIALLILTHNPSILIFFIYVLLIKSIAKNRR